MIKKTIFSEHPLSLCTYMKYHDNVEIYFFLNGNRYIPVSGDDVLKLYIVQISLYTWYILIRNDLVFKQLRSNIAANINACEFTDDQLQQSLPPTLLATWLTASISSSRYVEDIVSSIADRINSSNCNNAEPLLVPLSLADTM